MDFSTELHAFFFHKAQAPLHDLFLQLETRYAKGEQTADVLVALQHGDPVPRAVQLGRGRQSCRTGADDNHLLAGALLGRLGLHPAFFEAAFGDGPLDVLDGHCILVDGQSAGCFARSGADAPSEFGEVVGGREGCQGTLPLASVYQVVPIRYQVAQRAATVTERHATVHAARALVARLLLGPVLVELAEMLDTLWHGAPAWQLATELLEACDLTHRIPTLPSRAAAPAASVPAHGGSPLGTPSRTWTDRPSNRKVCGLPGRCPCIAGAPR